MKYKLGEKHLTENLYRIVALKDFGTVKAGDVGGWVESKKNLSQDGLCWVYGNAQVSEDAWVLGNANVFGDAHVYGDAEVFGDALVFGDAIVCEDVRVY